MIPRRLVGRRLVICRQSTVPAPLPPFRRLQCLPNTGVTVVFAEDINNSAVWGTPPPTPELYPRPGWHMLQCSSSTLSPNYRLSGRSVPRPATGGRTGKPVISIYYPDWWSTGSAAFAASWCWGDGRSRSRWGLGTFVRYKGKLSNSSVT